jgi:hypothetical protein
MLGSRQLFNHIRRYTHTYSPSSIKNYTALESKMNKISLTLYEIEFHVKGIYYVSVITGLILMFK